jgi:hypothetical protein
VRYYAEYPNEVVDYKHAAEFMMSAAKPGDLFFVRKRSWPTTPVFFYLGNDTLRYVADDYAAAGKDAQRIWMIDIFGTPPTPEMLEAVGSFEIVSRSKFRRCEVLLYQRDPKSAAPGE